MIQFENVSKSYGDTEVLHGISMSIPDSRLVVLIGPSGCGKTTTIKLVNRLLEPTSGQILIDGTDIQTVDKVDLRRHIGYVIQQIGLFPNMTVRQNISVVPRLLKYSRENCAEITDSLLNMVNMSEYADAYPNELSGGEQQRIGVLRALAASPPIVLMDEPFSALDPITREALQDEIQKLQRQLNKTILFVSHDMDEALKLADQIIFMSDGRILQTGKPMEIVAHPANDLVKDFFKKQTQKQEAATVECLLSKRAVPSENLHSDTAASGEGPVYVHSGEPAERAVELLLSTGAEEIIVVNDDGPAVGVITKESAVKALPSLFHQSEN